MLTLRDHQTGDLFDPREHLGEKRRRLLDRSRAAVFREHLLNHLPVAELAAHFSRELGRPTRDLHAAVGALILQQPHDTTDAATAEAVALNLAWQYALDIRAEADAYLCERTLRNYRQLLIERGLDRAFSPSRPFCPLSLAVLIFGSF
ncbi:MAG: transposase [Planctomycetia bacterium]|nr:transposase [Planctomycetia bacterium]